MLTHQPSTQLSGLRSIRRIANMPRVRRGDGFAVARLHAEFIDGGMDRYLQKFCL
jgi:hypothetical protein